MTIRIIKIASCGKLTSPETNTLTYNIGVDDAEKINMRVTDNSTGGLFSTEWIALQLLLDTIKKVGGKGSFHAAIFHSLFKQKSANNAGFISAALLAEGILRRFEKTKRMVTMGDVDTFHKAIKPLVDSDTSLHDVAAERMAEKQRKEEVRKQALAKSQKAKPAKKSTAKHS